MTTDNNTEPRHIDLHLPRSWNQCTTDELEQIAAAILMEQQRINRYRPFLWDEVKVRLIFAFNNLEVLGPATDDDDSAYRVRFAKTADRSLWQQLRYRIGRMFYHADAKTDDDTFELTVGYIHAMLPLLSWIDDEEGERIFRFPYPELTIQGITLKGATPLLDGYTWQEYRQLQEWMQLYTTQSNVLLRRIQRKDVPEKIAETQRIADDARANFLAILFNTESQLSKRQPTDPLNPDGSPVIDPVGLFRDFDPIQWQVILFWWSDLMRWLIQTYPKCFKKDKPSRRSRPANPLVTYARTIATLEKYISGGDEERINRKTFHVVLQELQMMAEESDEAKRMSQRYKSKK